MPSYASYTPGYNSPHYIADSDKSNPVHFGIDPKNSRFMKPSRVTSTKKCVPGSSNAGNIRTIDFGAGTGHKTILIECDDIAYDAYAALLTKFETYPPEQIIYSPDNGTTKYLCSWDGPDSLEPLPDEGIDPDTDSLGVRIKLRYYSNV